MTDQTKPSSAAPASGIGEAERMAKIRELLVGPAIADESVRVDQSFDRLDEIAKEQKQSIAVLQTRIQQLEDSQRIGMKRLQMRLLGMMEALLADEKDLQTRLQKNKILLDKVENDQESGG